MGCLFEIFFEIFIEGVLQFVMSVYLKFAQVFVPEKEIPPKTKSKIKNTITTVFVLLILTLFIGAFFLLPDDAGLNIIGKFMTIIPLTVIGLQMLVGLVAVVVKAFKRKRK